MGEWMQRAKENNDKWVPSPHSTIGAHIPRGNVTGCFSRVQINLMMLELFNYLRWDQCPCDTPCGGANQAIWEPTSSILWASTQLDLDGLSCA
ncbi:hypothetical protein EV2_025911 [Malus domestica]